MLGWVFSHLLVLGEVAWRYNVFSALAGSIAVMLVVATVLRLTQQRLAAVIAGLSLAGCYFFASQSVIAEVYALNSALIALMLYAAIRWKMDKQWLWLSILALCVGLIPNSHMSSIFVLPGLLVFLWPRHPKVLLRTHSKRLVGLALLAILGFSLTLYLPWRASTFSAPAAGPGGTLIYQPGDWGHPATFRNWWNHVSARQYRSILWDQQDVQIGSKELHLPAPSHSLTNAAGQMGEWFKMLSFQYLWLILLTITGAFVSWKWLPRLGWLLWLIFGINLFVQVNYKANDIGYITNLLFPAYIVVALWTGLGYHAVSKVLLGWEPKKQNLGRLLLQVAAIAAIAVQWITVYPAINHRNDTRALDTALQRAKAVQSLQNKTGKPVNVLMVTDDTLFPFWYAQRVLDKVPSAKTPWGPYRHYYWDNGHAMDLVHQLQGEGPLAVTEWNSQINAAFPLVPLNQPGTLWLASHRALPEPAKVLLSATVDADANTQKLQLPNDIKVDELFAATLEFTFDPANHQVIKRDSVNHTIQVGWVDIAYQEYNDNPNEPDESQISQRIPLVIPDTVKHPARLQMILPLQVPRKFTGLACDIWFRPTGGVWQRNFGVPLIH